MYNYVLGNKDKSKDLDTCYRTVYTPLRKLWCTITEMATDWWQELVMMMHIMQEYQYIVLANRPPGLTVVYVKVCCIVPLAFAVNEVNYLL